MYYIIILRSASLHNYYIYKTTYIVNGHIYKQKKNLLIYIVVIAITQPFINILTAVYVIKIVINKTII